MQTALNKSEELKENLISHQHHLQIELEQQRALSKEYQQEIVQLQIKLQKQLDEMADLRFRLQKALMHRYGQRTEKFSPGQLNLFDEPDLPPDVDTTDIQQADEEITVPAHTRKRAGRSPLPANLPREHVIHDLSEEEKICTCGHALHQIGEDTSEKLEFIPAQVKVIVHVRCKYACRACEGAVKMATLPTQPIPKSIASPGLLSHVIVSKYADHLPLYRQEPLFQRMGVEMARATLCFWVLRCAELMKPLVELLKENIIRGTYVQADETPVQVLNEPDKSNTSTSYMWVYRGGSLTEKSIVYEYQASRKGQAAEEFLCGFSGFLQTDGYAGYNGFAQHPGVTQAGCWAHARRKFADIIKVSKTQGKAHVAIATIRQLYAIEKEARENALTCEQRQKMRQERAYPILTQFKEWLDSTYRCVPPQSHIGKAIAYTLNQWPLLMTYVDHGEIEIDNNLIENTIRPFALGRRNWMFMGSERGAHAGAIIYSLLATCKAHLIEPYAYFKYILDQLPRCKSMEDRKKLLPYSVDKNLLNRAYSQPTWD